MPVDDFYRSFQMRTVCEVTREIFDVIEENRERIGSDIYDAIFEKLQEQMRMQKKMDLKLRRYRRDWDEGFYKKNIDHAEDEKRRGRENL